MSFTNEYMNHAGNCWRKYVLEDKPIPPTENLIRAEVLASWKRSKRYGVDPYLMDDPHLSASELEKVLDENAFFMRIATPYMNYLYNFVKGSNSTIHLTDKNGCVLQFVTEDELIQEFDNISSERTKIGSIRTEQYTGTNSTTVCLVLREPVQLIGEEHYLKRSQPFFCCSAPIFDSSEDLVGVMTIFSPRRFYQSHTLGMVCAAASGIQGNLRMQRAYDELALANKTLSTTIGSLSSAIIMLDKDLRIVQHNQNTVKLFRPGSDNLVGMEIDQVIKRSSLPKQFHGYDNDTNSYGFTLVTTTGKKVNVSLTTKIITNESCDDRMTVLIFEEQEHLHQLVSKISGFSAKYTFESLIGSSEVINSVKLMGKNAAKGMSNVLILGESGTGKELLAQSIHNASDRANGPFVAVNCGSIPKELIESELFGYEGGAFTGARKDGCPGKFELAHGGTLFLDEIGDMPFELQVSLLRVLQNRQIMRIGGKYLHKIDVRLIAATNSNLFEAVRQKKFRSDLFYRLNVFNISLPPLRERVDDILPLIRHFMQIYSRSMNKEVNRIDERVIEVLENHTWPGNIRELENIIERAINLAQSNAVTIHDLPDDLLNQSAGRHQITTLPPKQDIPSTAEFTTTRASVPYHISGNGPANPLSPEIREYNSIISALEQEKGHVDSAATTLAMPTRKLYRKIKKYNIDLKNYRHW
jgi:Transcriptional regulator containing PAS, AAA-type ATPase, and DNA-binding domains